MDITFADAVRFRSKQDTCTGDADHDEEHSKLLSLNSAHSSSSVSAFSASSDPKRDGVIHVPNKLLFLSMCPLLIIAYISHEMDLDIVKPILIGISRTFLQLTILSCILGPIFKIHSKPLVLGYCFFMIFLAAHTACGRSKYSYTDQFQTVFISLLANVTVVALFAFGVIIRPKPVYNPQYVIPITGMLLGNSINGISLVMNNLLIALVEQKHEIELYLSFGATSHEAVSRLLKEAVKSGTMPILNSMAVIGLISIPGMMTGQILGGNPVSEAARYQIMIMYFIAIASFGVILMQVTFILHRGFDSDHMLQSDYFEKSTMSGLGAARVVMTSMMAAKANPTMNEENLDGHGIGLAPSIEINPFHFDITEQDALQLVGISKWFPIEHRDLAGNIVVENRVLFDDLSFTVHSNEIVFVKGKSGSGKTQLLRSLARLSPLNTGDIFLNGMDQKRVRDMSEYRTKVRYVTQQKVDIPGTPVEFVKKITSFEAVKKDVTHPHDWHIMENTAGFLLKWGLDASILTSEWKNLSGGESQRVLLALALATRPWVILLDEVTSALDEKTTLLVEETLKETSLINGMKIVMVTHDENQIGRLTLHQ